MHLTPTRLALIVVTLAVAGVLLAIAPGRPVVWAGSGGLAILAAALLMLAPRIGSRPDESERIESLTIVRRAELVRGTSLRLREMRYRYSVRHDERGRMPFSTRINQIRLGFVPVVITDNENDMQGVGYVAFVHDGHRWRGPGLPCAGSPDEALAAAARHVEPLRDVEDTGDTSYEDGSVGGGGDDGDDGPFDPDADTDDGPRWDTGSGWDDDSEPGGGGART